MAYAISGPSAHNGIYLSLLAVTRKFNEKRAERRAYRLTRRQLMNLSDHTLADLGLRRSQIDRASLEATIGASRH